MKDLHCESVRDRKTKYSTYIEALRKLGLRIPQYHGQNPPQTHPVLSWGFVPVNALRSDRVVGWSGPKRPNLSASSPALWMMYETNPRHLSLYDFMGIYCTGRRNKMIAPGGRAKGVSQSSSARWLVQRLPSKRSSCLCGIINYMLLS